MNSELNLFVDERFLPFVLDKDKIYQALSNGNT